jgi:hypothetical protein
MNRPFKKATNEVLEILPVEEPDEENSDPDETKDNIKVVLKETDVFDIEAPISPKIEKTEKIVKVKRAVGKRGPDTKVRKKRVMDDAAKEKLKLARELSLQTRRALKVERDALRAAEKATAQAKIDEEIKFTALKQRKVAEDAADARFFNLMDKWDEGKQKKKKARKAAAKTVSFDQSHPAGRTVPKEQRPVPPHNPYEEFFNYKKNKSTFW